MKKIKIALSVADAAEHFTRSLKEKGFKIICDVDHQANANGVDLELPASRLLIFGNPAVGTKLMQQDLAMSLDLPLRLAIIDDAGQTLLIHHTSDDYCNNYQVENHPVLKGIEALFATLASEV